MLNNLKTKTILASGALALTLAFSPVSYAADSTVKTVQDVEKKVEQQQHDQTAEKRKEILSDATAALRETENALKALDEKKNKEALAALERAAGKLDIVLARAPRLALAPVGVASSTQDVLTSVDAVESLVDRAEDALKDGRVQEARALIGDLASETVISVSHLPMATYPGAIKAAVRLIDQDKPEAAKVVLQTALNSLVVTNTVIPLPVVTAEGLLASAEKLAEKADRSDDENKRLATLLEDARTELKFAEALGYGSKKDFKNLYEQLDTIEDKTEDGKSGTGFFTKIKGYLKDTVKSSQPEEKSDKQ